MHNNDILRSLRFSLVLTDEEVAALMTQGGCPMQPDGARARTGHSGDPEAWGCSDAELEAFLDGLILDRRGPPSPDQPPPDWVAFSNNEVLKKLRIALQLRAQDMLRIAKAGGQDLSKAELTALFRKPHHRHYRPCGDQLLRRFLRGLTLELRPDVGR